MAGQQAARAESTPPAHKERRSEQPDGVIFVFLLLLTRFLVDLAELQLGWEINYSNGRGKICLQGVG